MFLMIQILSKSPHLDSNQEKRIRSPLGYPLPHREKLENSLFTVSYIFFIDVKKESFNEIVIFIFCIKITVRKEIYL